MVLNFIQRKTLNLITFNWTIFTASFSNAYFQGAQTIKKSYSLSDLTETDGGDRVMMLQMQDLPVRHRVRPTIKNAGAVTRSTSLNKRPTSEMYTFQELAVKDSSNQQDFK